MTEKRPLSLLLACAAVLTATAGCKAKVPTITEPFSDDFERAEVGATWNDTSNGQYRVAAGKLNVAGAVNHPLWLRRKLPRDVVIELDVMSKSPQGDIKVEVFGDGESFDPDTPYNYYFPTGYVLVFGGWGNTLSIIGRKGEHEDAVKVKRADVKVEPNRTYRFTITRKGNTLDWKVDGQPFLSWEDPEPLAGEGQQFFGVNNFKTDLYFDNLTIRPAP